tara:strand:- start:1541 stop:1918 length:378 start_codon:yes stop_codon:yes gene_type:complete
MINLNIKFTETDLQVLSMMELTQEDYEECGSYSHAVECKGWIIEEDFCDAIKLGEYPELKEQYEQFQLDRDHLVLKLEKAETEEYEDYLEECDADWGIEDGETQIDVTPLSFVDFLEKHIQKGAN